MSGRIHLYAGCRARCGRLFPPGTKRDDLDRDDFESVIAGEARQTQHLRKFNPFASDVPAQPEALTA